MGCIYLISGPCGCGKTTFTERFAKELTGREGKPQVYVVHGDDFHKGFVETDQHFELSGQPFMHWKDILEFNWECMISVAGKVLSRGLDVIIDYVVENELSQVKSLAERYGAKLCYIVLTAEEETISSRLKQRGDEWLIGRALELKKILEGMPENQGHLLWTDGKTPEQLAGGVRIDQYMV